MGFFYPGLIPLCVFSLIRAIDKILNFDLWQESSPWRLLWSTWHFTTLTPACVFLSFCFCVLPRGESANSSRGHSSGQSIRDVCDSSEEGQHEVRSAACHINAPEPCLPLSALHTQRGCCHIITKQHFHVCMCKCVILCAPPGPRWKRVKQSWALWWAVGHPGPCWLGPSSSPCTTAPCLTANRIGWSSSRTSRSRASGRWDVWWKLCRRFHCLSPCSNLKLSCNAEYQNDVFVTENTLHRCTVSF